jgi:hypothetical protein
MITPVIPRPPRPLSYPQVLHKHPQASTSYPQAAMLARVLHGIPQGEVWVCIRIPIDHTSKPQPLYEYTG